MHIYSLDLGRTASELDERFTQLHSRVRIVTFVKPVHQNGRSATDSLVKLALASTVPSGPCFWLGNALAIDAEGMAYSCLLENGMLIGEAKTEAIDILIGRALTFRREVSERTRIAVGGCSKCQKAEGHAFDNVLQQSFETDFN